MAQVSVGNGFGERRLLADMQVIEGRQSVIHNVFT
jgi:hypothetical protein